MAEALPASAIRSGGETIKQMSITAIATILMCCLLSLPACGNAEQGFNNNISMAISEQAQLTEEQEAEILQQLVSYPKSLPGLVSSDEREVVKNLSLLCDFRSSLGKGGYNYEELLISQLIDRVAAISLLQHIISTGSVSSEIKELCIRVSSVEYDPEAFESVFSATTKPSLDAVRARLKEVKLPEFPKMDSVELTDLQLENAEKLKRYYRLLMISSGSETLEEALAQPGASSDWNVLYSEKDVTSLLLMLWHTDSFVHKALPAVALYIENCPDSSIKDDSNKIRAVLEQLDLEEVLPSSYFGNESFTISVSRILRRVREGRLNETAGLGVAQKILSPAPDSELMIEKSLFGIESAKSQIKMSKSLEDGDEITLEEIESFLRRKVFVPENGGEYQVGVLGAPAKFIYPDGRIINGTVIETLSMDTLEKRRAERRAKEVDEVNKELKSKGIEVIVVPPISD